MDATYQDFMDHLKENVAQCFPKKEEELERAELLVGNELSKMLKQYLRHMNIIPRGRLPYGTGPEPFEDRTLRGHKKQAKPRPEKPTPEEEQRLKAKLKTNNPITRTRRSEFGF
jgi:hypothetical protein